LIPKVIKSSYPVEMVCECETLTKDGVEIHTLPAGDLVCENPALLKFDCGDETLWLCASCLVHHRLNEEVVNA